jgi:hypothetical protein
LGWLAGGLLMTGSMALLAMIPLHLALENWPGIASLVLFALVTFALGGGSWYLAEAALKRSRPNLPISGSSPAADWALLACAVLAALLVSSATSSLGSRPTVFTYEQFRDFLMRGRIWKIDLKKQDSGSYLECEVFNNPDHEDVRALNLRGNRFVVVDIPANAELEKDITAQLGRQAQPLEYRVIASAGAKDLPLGPGRLVIAQTLALPVLVALLCGPFLGRMFPGLHTAGLRPWA